MNGDLVDEHSICTSWRWKMQEFPLIPARQAKNKNGVPVHILHTDHTHALGPLKFVL